MRFLTPARRRILLLTIASLLLSSHFAWALDSRMNEALYNLDISLRGSKATYDSVMTSLEGVKARMISRAPEGDYEGIDSLIKGYIHRQVDSAHHYTRRGLLLARERGDANRELRYRAFQTRYLPLIGQTHEAIVLVDSILGLRMNSDVKIHVLSSLRQALLVITSLYARPNILDGYFSRYVSVNDSLLGLIAPTDSLHRLLTGTKFLGEKNYYLASAHLQQALEELPPDTYAYVNAASMLAFLNYSRGRMDEWAYYLTLAATSEARQANIDSECLRLLSSYLASAGDTRRAESYAFTSHENISRSGAFIRNVHESEVFSEIIQSFRESTTRAHLLLVGVVILLILSLMLVVALVMMKMKNIRSLRASRQRLEAANQSKDSYISHFLSLYGSFAERAEEQQKFWLRKLTARQYDEVLSSLKSGRFREEQLAMFRESFDTGFLNLIPDFVERVNDLLEPGRRFKVSNDGKLTPELRILAFLRFGITDNARIARFLNLTLNTVYTYRTRIRNRAINRDTFETDIQAIGL